MIVLQKGPSLIAKLRNKMQTRYALQRQLWVAIKQEKQKKKSNLEKKKNKKNPLSSTQSPISMPFLTLPVYKRRKKSLKATQPTTTALKPLRKPNKLSTDKMTAKAS